MDNPICYNYTVLFRGPVTATPQGMHTIQFRFYFHMTNAPIASKAASTKLDPMTFDREIMETLKIMTQPVSFITSNYLVEIPRELVTPPSKYKQPVGHECNNSNCMITTFDQC